MKENKLKELVETYQCMGCSEGNDISCYRVHEAWGIGCGNQRAGTFLKPFGKIFLGMPKGFNRLGQYNEQRIIIIEDAEGVYDKFNIPVWKYLDKNSNTLVRGLSPRTNYAFVHIFPGDQRNKISCFEVDHELVEWMD